MKTAAVYSGGLDSTVLLYDMRDAGHDMAALSVDYGQRHRFGISRGLTGFYRRFTGGRPRIDRQNRRALLPRLHCVVSCPRRQRGHLRAGTQRVIRIGWD